MKIGKYNIVIQKKELVLALFSYASYFTFGVLIANKSGKEAIEFGAFISGLIFIWNTFWFNYYEIKKQNKEQSVQVSDTTKLNRITKVGNKIIN